jgi:hypothetical protein
LGLKHGSSQTLGLLDVVASWEAFETINQCVVTLQLIPVRHGGRWAVRMTGVVWNSSPGGPGVSPLACESLICSPLEWKSLDTVAFRLLYLLDGQLAAQQLANDPESKA